MRSCSSVFIPVGVGIARTKTLAKLANHTAKRLQAQTGGVVDICETFKRDWMLRNTDVSEVWGVGRRMKAHLDAMGIKTAMDLAKADPWTLRKKFSVVIEKTARELAGISCLELDVWTAGLRSGILLATRLPFNYFQRDCSNSGIASNKSATRP
jgi:nucleotidyltransferase/DNA polymerase involved in DNA repair